MRFNCLTVLPLAGLLAGCAPPAAEVPEFADSTLLSPGCFTVDLFDDRYGRNEVQEPKPGLPGDWNAYLGVWGGGAWNGGQCHELYVTEVFQDGSAVIINTTAPFGELRAVSHRGAGRINDDGDLVVPNRSGRVVVYSFDGSRLRGTRFNVDGSIDQILLTPQER